MYARPLVPPFGKLVGLAVEVEHQMDLFNHLYKGLSDHRYVRLF